VAGKSDVKTEATKRFALELYLEGVGFRSIGRILKVSYGSVFQWIKKYGQQLEVSPKAAPAQLVELAEMHTYVGTKKTTVGYGLSSMRASPLLLIDLENGLSLLSVGTDQQKQV
jgi:transposase